MKDQFVSFVIVTHNRLDVLKRCIKSIIEKCQIDYEIIIVDNFSCDGTREWLKDSDCLRYVLLEENLGPGPGRNKGVEISNGPFLCFLDDDSYLDSGEIICNALLKMDSSFHLGCVTFPMWEDELGCLIYGKISGRTKCFSAGGALFRKIAFIKAGGFDEKIKWSEEFDLSIRTYVAGYDILTLESPPVVHHHSVISSRLPHSPTKLRLTAYGRFRSFFINFSIKKALIMSTRVAATIIYSGLRTRSISPIPLAIFDLFKTLPEIMTQRKKIPKDIEEFFTKPNFEEDEFSVPLFRKLKIKLEEKMNL